MQNKILAVVALVAIVLSGVLVREHERKVLSDAETQVRVAHDSLVAVQKEIKQVNADAVVLKAGGVKLTESRDSALRVASITKTESARLKAKIDADTSAQCAALRAEVDSMAREDSAAYWTVLGALTREKAHSDSLQTVLDESLSALARLNAAAGHVDDAAHAAVKAAKPSFWSKIAPKPGFGVAAGIDPQMKFDTVAGVTLGWSF